MEMLRTFWPSLIGAILILYLLAVLVLRKSPEGRFLDRNREGVLLLGSCALLFLLLVGAQIALSRSFGEIGDFRRSARRDLESARSGSREWSIRYGIIEAERDSLRSGWEWAEENRESVPIRGEVLARDAGAPVGGALVSISRHDPTRHIGERKIAEGLRCDGEGRFETVGPRLGPHGAFRVEVRAEGFRPAREWVTTGAESWRITIFLDP